MEKIIINVRKRHRQHWTKDTKQRQTKQKHRKLKR